MYKILPETENRTLEDIELHFSDNSRKLTDRHIYKSKSSTMKKSKDIESNGQLSHKQPISSISEIVELNENGNLQTGCDNKGFTLETIDR